MRPEPFSISVAQDVLDDLKHRLAHTRWPHDMGNDDWSYGVNLAYLKELVAYWADGYDWRRQERAFNAFAHYKTTVDGIPIHFIREPGKGPKPMPLIMTHGWPWTFWDYHQLIRPLADPASFGGDPADAFEVIVPSLPGFGFSTPLTTTGINYWRTADLWHELMTKALGFPRFAAQGGDWGAMVTGQLSHKYADSLYGIHSTALMPPGAFASERAWDIIGPHLAAAPPDIRARMMAMERRIASHVTTHVLDPQTLAYGAADSPVALLAWILERRRAWSDCGGDVESRFSKDDLLTNATIYWVTNSFVTSVRYYAEAARNPWRPSHDRMPIFEAPAGITLMAGDGCSLPPAPELLACYNIHYLKERPSGGHFAPAEEPDAVIEDVRATFRALR